MKKMYLFTFIALGILTTSCYQRTCPTYVKKTDKVEQMEQVKPIVEVQETV